MSPPRTANRKPQSVAVLLQRALSLHQTGDLAGAESLYAEILTLQSRNIDALYLDGLAAHQSGDYARSLQRLNKARQISPTVPAILTALGNTHRDQGTFAAADESYQAALKLDPHNADAHYNQGIAYQERGDLENAVAAYRQALVDQPSHADSWNNLGVALKDSGHSAEAAACYLRAIALQPQYATAHFNLGVLHDEEKKFEAAAVSYRRSLKANPAYGDAAFNLGVACKNLGRLGEAADWFSRALALEPKHAGAMQNLGATYYELGNLDAAETHYRQALAATRGSPAVRYNLSLIALARGDYTHGWEEFEWRWLGAESSKRHRRDFPQPQWRGEDLTGLTILLHAEQGLGDTLQFVRYVPLVAAQGARVILECQPSLARLLGSLQGIEEIVQTGQQLPVFDLHCPLMSLPHAFGTTLESVPAQIPYLRPDPSDVATWAGRLDSETSLRIGLVWAGNPRQFSIDLNLIDRRRSLPLTLFAPLCQIPDITLYSLQLGEAAAESRNNSEPSLIDLTEHISDFADTAALIAHLDLVISVDTSVAHLAGALGKPVWLLSRHDACWRWLRERDDSPWYPSVRIFRQPAPGDWGAVMGRITNCLAVLAASANTRETSS